MKYRDLKPDELVEEGDEVLFPHASHWWPSDNWRWGARGQTRGCQYRRPIKGDIQDRLQALAVDMRAVSKLMLADNQTLKMQSKGVELQGASATINEWIEAMRAEEIIQGFVEERKL